MSTFSAVESFLTRFRDRWRALDELGHIDHGELDRIAKDLGVSTADLTTLAEQGPDAAHLLYERMHALGISRDNVEHAASGLMRDLERTCACCNEKGLCEKDLRGNPDGTPCKSYCPNAIALDDLVKLKNKSAARASTT